MLNVTISKLRSMTKRRNMDRYEKTTRGSIYYKFYTHAKI